MSDLRISDAPLLPQDQINDFVKLPTGGEGNYSLQLSDLAWYVIADNVLADIPYVNQSVSTVNSALQTHIADTTNPHQVTKAQVGLDQVDNTADLDKPISNATQSAIITAVNGLATNEYVDSLVSHKADKSTTLVGYGITDAYTKGETDVKIANKTVNTLSVDSNDLLQLKLGDNTTKSVDLTSVFDNGVARGISDSNVLVQQPFTGAIGLTQHSKNLEFVSVKDFGAVGDGVTDDTESFKNAATTGVAIYIPDGDYIVTDTINFLEDMIVNFSAGAKIIAQGNSFTGGYVLRCVGSTTLIPDLAVDAIKGQASLTLATATTLSYGDVLCLFNPTAYSWSQFRAEYKAGEFVVVDSVNNTGVKLTSCLYDSYIATNIDVYKINRKRVWLNNPTIVSNVTSLTGLIRAEYCYGEINNPTLTSGCYSGIGIYRSVNMAINGGTIFNKGANSPADYAVSINNSQHIRIIGGRYHARRHAGEMGGNTDICCVTNRDVKFIGCTLSNDLVSGTHSANMHGNVEYCGYYNCTIYNGVGLAGANNDTCDNTIYGGMQNGTCVYAGEVLGGSFNITNNILVTFTDPSTVGLGLIDFGGNSSPITEKTTRDLVIIVKGNTLEATSLSTATTFVVVRNRGSLKKISLDCQHNTLNVNALLAAATVRNETSYNGVVDTDYIIVDNNVCSQTGVYSLYPHNSYPNLPKLRCQGETWSVDVTTTGGSTSVVAPQKEFRWKFPRTPHIFASRRGLIGFTMPSVANSTSATLSLYKDLSGGTFTGVATVTLYGKAEICEV